MKPPPPVKIGDIIKTKYCDAIRVIAVEHDCVCPSYHDTLKRKFDSRCPHIHIVGVPAGIQIGKERQSDKHYFNGYYLVKKGEKKGRIFSLGKSYEGRREELLVIGYTKEVQLNFL